MQQGKFLLDVSEKVCTVNSQTLKHVVQRGCDFSIHKVLSNLAQADTALSSAWDQTTPRDTFQPCGTLQFSDSVLRGMEEKK